MVLGTGNKRHAQEPRGKNNFVQHIKQALYKNTVLNEILLQRKISLPGRPIFKAVFYITVTHSALF